MKSKKVKFFAEYILNFIITYVRTIRTYIFSFWKSRSYKIVTLIQFSYELLIFSYKHRLYLLLRHNAVRSRPLRIHLYPT